MRMMIWKRLLRWKWRWWWWLRRRCGCWHWQKYGFIYFRCCWFCYFSVCRLYRIPSTYDDDDDDEMSLGTSKKRAVAVAKHPGHKTNKPHIYKLLLFRHHPSTPPPRFPPTSTFHSEKIWNRSLEKIQCLKICYFLESRYFRFCLWFFYMYICYGSTYRKL